MFNCNKMPLGSIFSNKTPTKLYLINPNTNTNDPSSNILTDPNTKYKIECTANGINPAYYIANQQTLFTTAILRSKSINIKNELLDNNSIKSSSPFYMVIVSIVQNTDPLMFTMIPPKGVVYQNRSESLVISEYRFDLIKIRIISTRIPSSQIQSF